MDLIKLATLLFCIYTKAYTQDCNSQLHIQDLRYQIDSNRIVKEFEIDFLQGTKHKVSHTINLKDANMNTYFIHFGHRTYGNRGLIVNVYYMEGNDRISILDGTSDGRSYQKRMSFLAPYTDIYEIEFKYHKGILKSYCAGAMLLKN